MEQKNRNPVNRLIVAIALVIVIGILQIALAFHALSAGRITHWSGAIVGVGFLFNVAIITYLVTNAAKTSVRKG